MTDSLKIALAQCNPTMGDIAGNLALLRHEVVLRHHPATVPPVADPPLLPDTRTTLTRTDRHTRDPGRAAHLGPKDVPVDDALGVLSQTRRISFELHRTGPRWSRTWCASVTQPGRKHDSTQSSLTEAQPGR